MMSDWKVELIEDNICEFHVDFHGPKDSEWGCVCGLAVPLGQWQLGLLQAKHVCPCCSALFAVLFALGCPCQSALHA